jgi:hypothetical protein
VVNPRGPIFREASDEHQYDRLRCLAVGLYHCRCMYKSFSRYHVYVPGPLTDGPALNTYLGTYSLSSTTSLSLLASCPKAGDEPPRKHGSRATRRRR